MANSAIAQAAEIIAPQKTYIISVDGDFNDVVREQLSVAGISIDDEFVDLGRSFSTKCKSFLTGYKSSSTKFKRF